MGAKKVAVLLFPKVEEGEAVVLIDLLRRANIETITYGLEQKTVVGKHGIGLVADQVFQKKEDILVSSYDALVLPGGPGIMQIKDNRLVLDIVQSFFKQNKILFAICAAPLVFAQAGILAGKEFTCFPQTANAISGAKKVNKKVVRDQNIITAEALGSAIEGALLLIQTLVSEERSEAVKKEIFF